MVQTATLPLMLKQLRLSSSKYSVSPSLREKSIDPRTGQLTVHTVPHSALVTPLRGVTHLPALCAQRASAPGSAAWRYRWWSVADLGTCSRTMRAER